MVEDEEFATLIEINMQFMLLSYFCICMLLIVMNNLFKHIWMHKYISPLFFTIGFILLVINGWVMGIKQNVNMSLIRAALGMIFFVVLLIIVKN